MNIFIKVSTLMLLVLSPISVARPGDGLIPPPPQDECVSPNGEGLGKAVRELVNLIPALEWLEIYMIAISNDAEVMRVMEYISGDEFRQIVDTMNSQPEYSQVLEYFCEELHFHVYFYLNSAAEMLGLPLVTRPPKLQSTTYRRQGFNGMIQVLYDALPHEELKNKWETLYSEDEYLRLAMEKLGSEEFRVIGDVIEELDAFKNLMQSLRDLGVDADGLLKKIMDFFGWRPHIKPTTSNYSN